MTYVRHEPCEHCGSRDNKAVYTDHSYCFGCGYIEHFGARRPTTERTESRSFVALPEDIAPRIPAVADQWIKKYDLTLRELYDNRVVWSEYRQLLIFPYFDDKGHLWGWQGRYFGNDPKHPKWTGKGAFKEQIKIHGDLTRCKESGIIIVEDIISTIKLSRIYNTTCLYGSYIDINKYCNIYNIYKPSKYIIWLDKDKEKESRLFSLQFNKLGIPSEVVSTERDPKEYNTLEIKEIIESKATNHPSSP